MKTITLDDGVVLSYRVLGEGPRPVLLVHGWMMSSAVFDDCIEVLELAGVRLLVPDLRGSGRSGQPKTGYDIGRYARDLWALLDAEAGAKGASAVPTVIIGHSMGGQVAQWMAAERPGQVGGLVLLCPVPAQGMALPDDARGLFRGSAGNREMQRTILDLACKELSPSARERLLDVAAGVSEPAIVEAFDAWSSGGFAERLGAIRAPTLTVATSDPFLPPAFLRQTVTSLIAGSRLAVLPGPGHYPQVERPRETAALIEAFLAGLGA